MKKIVPAVVFLVSLFAISACNAPYSEVLTEAYDGTLTIEDGQTLSLESKAPSQTVALTNGPARLAFSYVEEHDEDDQITSTATAFVFVQNDVKFSFDVSSMKTLRGEGLFFDATLTGQPHSLLTTTGKDDLVDVWQTSGTATCSRPGCTGDNCIGSYNYVTLHEQYERPITILFGAPGSTRDNFRTVATFKGVYKFTVESDSFSSGCN